MTTKGEAVPAPETCRSAHLEDSLAGLLHQVPHAHGAILARSDQPELLTLEQHPQHPPAAQGVHSEVDAWTYNGVLDPYLGVQQEARFKTVMQLPLQMQGLPLRTYRGSWVSRHGGTTITHLWP